MKIKDRIKELRRVRARELVQNPKNWRTHPAAQARALGALLKEIGYADALIARELPDGQLQLIDGHLRAETTPNTDVPVLVLDVSEEEADKLLATLDPLAAMAEADTGRLQALLESVRSDDEAVQELLRRTAGERLWQILHPHEVDEVAVALERADELRVRWGTEHGQLWKIEEHRLICGDCTDEAVIARLWCNCDERRLRLIWTDPPYGVSYADKTAWLNQHGAQTKRRPIHNDDLAPAQIASLFSTSVTNAAGRAMPGVRSTPVSRRGRCCRCSSPPWSRADLAINTAWCGSSRALSWAAAIIITAMSPSSTGGAKAGRITSPRIALRIRCSRLTDRWQASCTRPRSRSS